MASWRIGATRTFAFLLGTSVCATAPAAFAQPGTPMPESGTTATDETTNIYGHELMTPSEVHDYQTRLGTLSGTDRQRFLAQHRTEMQQRAQQRGVTLPDTGSMDEHAPGTLGGDTSRGGTTSGGAAGGTTGAGDGIDGSPSSGGMGGGVGGGGGMGSGPGGGGGGGGGGH